MPDKIATTSNYIEHYFSFWQGCWVIRCSCWRHQIFDGIAVNNGYHPAENYPHAPYCLNRRT